MPDYGDGDSSYGTLFGGLTYGELGDFTLTYGDGGLTYRRLFLRDNYGSFGNFEPDLNINIRNARRKWKRVRSSTL